MKITVDLHLFRSMFANHGRSDDFSYEALEALFDYYDDLDQSCDTDTELDVIAICCDWTEYDIDDLLSDYGHIVDSYDEDDGQEERLLAILHELEDQTTVVEVSHYRDDATYLVAAF